MMKSNSIIVSVVLILSLLSCEKEEIIDNYSMCADNTCEDIRTYILRSWTRGEAIAKQYTYTMDENGYYHFPMNTNSPLGHTTDDPDDDLARYISIQSFIDDGYIAIDKPNAPSYAKPHITASYKSNYWYTVNGGVFVGNRYDIFSSTNGQTRIPTSNSLVRTAYVEEQINVVQGGVRWLTEADRGNQWTTRASVYMSSRFIGDTITIAARFLVGGGPAPAEVIQEFNIIVEP